MQEMMQNVKRSFFEILGINRMPDVKNVHRGLEEMIEKVTISSQNIQNLGYILFTNHSRKSIFTQAKSI